MKTLRYILFIPIAFIASVIISALIQMVSTMFFGQIIGWALSGAFGSMSFILVGLFIAPKPTETIKYSLSGILILLSILSLIGSQINEIDLNGVWASLTSIIVAVGILKVPAGELIQVS